MTRLAGAVLALSLAACSSSGHGAAARTSSTPAPSSSAYVPAVGDDAALVAQHIPGCTAVAAGTVGDGGPKLASVATCRLSGYLVIVDSWTAAADATLAAVPGSSDVYTYAHGDGWTAFLADQGATASTTTLQEALTNDASAIFREATDGDPYPPPPAAAQARIARQVADALGGVVATTG